MNILNHINIEFFVVFKYSNIISSQQFVIIFIHFITIIPKRQVLEQKKTKNQNEYNDFRQQKMELFK